jgi:glycosyltransferase involved in cell wall biosynthesis
MHRVLYDLFFAGLPGHSGIPQDTRLLAKTLAHVGGCDPAFLVHSHFPTTAVRKALPNAPELALSMVLNGGPSDPQRRTRREIVDQFIRRRLERALGGRRFDTFKVENRDYFDSLWRVYFRKSLAPADREILRNCEIRISAISESDMRTNAQPRRRPFLNTDSFDFVLFQQNMNVSVSAKTRKLMRYHDPIPLLAADTSPAGERSSRNHYNLLKTALDDSYLICNSAVTRDQVVALFPHAAERCYVIPYMLNPVSVGHDGLPLADLVRAHLSFAALEGLDIDRSRVRGRLISECESETARFEYVLFVSTLEPRKNFEGAIAAVERVRRRTGRDLRIVIVGHLGWRHERVLAAMRPGVERGAVIHLTDLGFEDLIGLYRSASALLFPSFAEGFGFPPVEAMQCGTPAVVSDLPVHRWVMEDAVLYADPYDVTSIAEQIERIVYGDPRAELRDDLAARAQRVLERFSLEASTRAWSDLFDTLSRQPAPASGRSIV